MSSPALSKFLQSTVIPTLKKSSVKTPEEKGTRYDLEHYPGQVFRFDLDLHAKVLKGMHDNGEFGNKDGVVLDEKYFKNLLVGFCTDYEKYEDKKIRSKISSGGGKVLKSSISKGTEVKYTKEGLKELKKLAKQHTNSKFYAIPVRTYANAKEFYTQGKANLSINIHKRLTNWEEKYLGKEESGGAKVLEKFKGKGDSNNRFKGRFNQEIGHGYEVDGKQEGVAATGYTTMRAASQILGSKEFQNAPPAVQKTIMNSFQEAFEEYGISLEQASKMGQKDFLKGFDLILTTQDFSENRTQSGTESTAISKVTEKLVNHVGDLKSSLSLNEMINHFLMSSFQGNKHVKLNQKYKESYRSNSRSKTMPFKVKYKRLTPIVNSGVQFSKTHIARRSLQKRGTRQKSSNRLNPLAMINMINKKLPGEVEKNMGLPGLESRTGRFASSAKVVNFTEGKKGTPTLDYTYQKNPYQVFEEGERGRNGWASTSRDPRRVIDRSIREVAKDLALARFNTRRI